MSAPTPDRTRISLTIITALWLSALAILFIGFRLHLKPVILVGGLNLLLALATTGLLFSRHSRS